MSRIFAKVKATKTAYIRANITWSSHIYRLLTAWLELIVFSDCSDDATYSTEISFE